MDQNEYNGLAQRLRKVGHLKVNCHPGTEPILQFRNCHFYIPVNEGQRRSPMTNGDYDALPACFSYRSKWLIRSRLKNGRVMLRWKLRSIRINHERLLLDRPYLHISPDNATMSRFRQFLFKVLLTIGVEYPCPKDGIERPAEQLPCPEFSESPYACPSIY